jgi:hypothetical protein
MPSPVGIFKSRTGCLCFAELLAQTNNLVQFLNLGVLIVNRELGVTDNVEKEDMRDFEFDLFLNFGGHLDLHGNARRNDTLKQAAESRAQG